MQSESDELGLKTGELVEVRSEQEILASLDANGCRDGLPFMPEMLRFAGRRFRVESRADKTCDTISQTGGRRLRRTVHLETRCDGSAHGGCHASCLLFWNEAWLKRVDHRDDSPSRSAASSGNGCTLQQLERATRRTTDPEGAEEVRYRCQATELLAATRPLAWWDGRQYWRDWRGGNATLARIARVLLVASFNAIQRWRGGRGYPPGVVLGNAKVTPSRRLDLKPGEWVRVRSLADIGQTLDANCRNRGLWFDIEMYRYCGGVYRVKQRVDHIIDERTGAMRWFKSDCVMLEGVACQSEFSRCRLFCPRRIPSYWREVWLERVNEPVEIRGVSQGESQCAGPTITPELAGTDAVGSRVPALHR